MKKTDIYCYCRDAEGNKTIEVNKGYSLNERLSVYKKLDTIYVIDVLTGLSIAPEEMFRKYKGEIVTFKTFRAIENNLDEIMELFRKVISTKYSSYARMQNDFKDLMEEYNEGRKNNSPDID